MSMASIEACPSDILCKIITPELLHAINECADPQLRHIFYHHTNAFDIYNQARSENVFSNQADLSSLDPAIKLACMFHDLGKIRVPKDIFPIPLSSKQVKRYFRQHPADTLKLLGKKFCQLEDSIPAQIIINHHWYSPGYLSKIDQQQLGFTITPLDKLDDGILLALTVFTASDRAAALCETRQHNQHKDSKSSDTIITDLQQDIKFLNQTNPFINSINLPALIEIAQTVSQQNQHILEETQSLR